MPGNSRASLDSSGGIRTSYYLESGLSLADFSIEELPEPNGASGSDDFDWGLGTLEGSAFSLSLAEVLAEEFVDVTVAFLGCFSAGLENAPLRATAAIPPPMRTSRQMMTIAMGSALLAAFLFVR